MSWQKTIIIIIMVKHYENSIFGVESCTGIASELLKSYDLCCQNFHIDFNSFVRTLQLNKVNKRIVINCQTKIN